MIGCINQEDFNFEIDQFSPVFGDVERVCKFDEEGNERVSFKEVDYPSLVASRGTVEQYKLNNLLAANIDPNFKISTGQVSRVEGVEQLRTIQKDVDDFFNKIND